MNIWIVLDDCPPEFGKKEIIRIFSSRTLATYFMNKMKDKKPYECQYYNIIKYRVWSRI